MKTTFRWIILALSMVSASAFAAGSPDPAPVPEKKKDSVLEGYQQASARQDWTAAAAALRGGIAADPSNAEYHNLYAYSLRKGEPDERRVQALQRGVAHRSRTRARTSTSARPT